MNQVCMINRVTLSLMKFMSTQMNQIICFWSLVRIRMILQSLKMILKCSKMGKFRFKTWDRFYFRIIIAKIMIKARISNQKRVLLMNYLMCLIDLLLGKFYCNKVSHYYRQFTIAIYDSRDVKTWKLTTVASLIKALQS